MSLATRLGELISAIGTDIKALYTAVAFTRWKPISANYTAVSKDRLAVNTSTAAISVTLPATPTTGDFVEFMDAKKSFATNNLTVLRNGQTIEGIAEDMTVSTKGAWFGLYFNGTTWVVY